MSGKYVGFSRVDIEPWNGLEMPGYYEKRYAEGSYDPIELQGIAFREGNETAVLLVSDTLGLYSDLAFAFPGIVGEAANIPADHVLICHTHTHTGPIIDHYRGKGGDPAFLAHYKNCLIACAKEAIEDLKPLREVCAGEGAVPNFTAPRRVKKKSGVYRTWGEPGDPENLCFAGRTDESFRVIRFLREEGPEVVLLNFQCHPDCVGGSYYSADYPGAFRRAFEEENLNTRAVFVDGAEGQMIGPDLMRPVPKPKGIDQAYRMGQKLADYVQPTYLAAHLLSDTTALKCGQKTFTAETKYYPERYEAALEAIKNHEEGHPEKNGPTKADNIYVVSEAYVIRDLVDRGIRSMEVPLSFLCFAGLALVGVPGEPFCEMGLVVRALSPYPVTFIACHGNGSIAYFPTAESYDQGGYEPSNCRVVKGTLERMEDLCIKTLREMHEL